MTITPYDDELDGYLFRLWCRAASFPGGSPSLLAWLISEHGPKQGEGNARPHHYRAALMAYAKETGANLPEPLIAKEAD